MLIGISGKKRHGKNTVAEIIYNQSLLGATKSDYSVFSFAANLKVVVQDIYSDWELDIDEHKKDVNPIGLSNSEGHLYTNREILQQVGTKLREIDSEIWIKSLNKYIKNVESCTIISDVRFPNEAAWIKEKGGILIRVNRPGMPEDDHISETALDDYKDWDYVIENNGSEEDLVEKVNQMIKDLNL